jgi:predicted metal-dependent hydrolase
VKGDIRLAWRLVQASPATVDYVVVHELAHLIEMNHSRRFWAIVAGACPTYRDACAELDRMGPYYMDV